MNFVYIYARNFHERRNCEKLIIIIRIKYNLKKAIL